MSGGDSNNGTPLDPADLSTADLTDSPTIRTRSATIKESRPVPPAVAGAPGEAFVEVISDDLVVDAAESLRLIRPVPDAEPDADGGISLQEIGAVIQTRATTQKIKIRGIDPEEEDTVVDIAGEGETLRDSILRDHVRRENSGAGDEVLRDDDGETERLGADDLAKLERSKK